jgi:hypothetical protein
MPALHNPGHQEGGSLMRYALAFLLCTASSAHPATVIVAWDFPLAQYPGTRFVLRIVTLHNGRPTQQERPIDPFPVERCAQRPDLTRTAETLCGPVCLDPGDYTLSLYATQGSERSEMSNLLDADLQSTTPCTPVVPPPPHPPPPPSTAASTAATAATAAALLAVGQAASAPAMATLPNLGCVSWKIVGPCVCSPLHPCVAVEYMEPAFLVEVVPKPGETIIPVLGDLLQNALSAAGIPPIGGGGAGNASGSGHTNLRYAEVHVYGFPNLLGGPCTGCGPSGSLGIHYASEIDSATWRTAVAVPSPLDLLLHVGVWGRLYPRGGKVIHSSEPVASALVAVRALDIMRQPLGTPPNVDAHVILQPGDGGTPAACMQLAYPRMTPCLTAGMPPPLWETGTLSITGRYVWVIWKQRRCCVNPAQSTCGITLPGIGGYGANQCPIPQIPTP